MFLHLDSSAGEIKCAQYELQKKQQKTQDLLLL